MSELAIEPDLGAPIECEVGDVLTITVIGTVIAKNDDGAKTLEISEILSYDQATNQLQAEVPLQPTNPAPPGAAAALLARGA